MQCIQLSVLLVGLVGAVLGQMDMPMSRADAEMISQMYARDAEDMPGPMSFGSKYMTGGAGEGYQALEPNGDYQFRQQVKSDSELPAYCNPPNPCPKGFSSDEGCMPAADFENTAAFSKKYQESQNCLCDEEHMRSCPSHDQEGAGEEDFDAAVNAMLEKNNVESHQPIVAKKGDRQLDPLIEHFPRKRRSVGKEDYAWLKGEKLIRVAKKG